MPRNDPTDTGGLFLGRRPGTRPIRYRDTPVRKGTTRQRADDWLAFGLLAAEVLLCLTLWGPQPAAWLWVGGHVQGWTHNIEAALQVADTVLVMGRDRDSSGAAVPGARIQESYDLISAGLAWRKGLNSTPEFVEVERKIRERFRTL